MLKLVEPRLADAMLGADRATEIGDDVVHDAIDVAALLPIARAIPVRRTHRVIVDVAIADVSEGARTDARIGTDQRPIGALDEFGDARNRHRDVVGDAATG